MREATNPSAKELNHRSRVRVWNAAVQLSNKNNRKSVALLIHQVKNARRPYQREAAAWALGFFRSRKASAVLESVLRDKRESAKVRGQAAESLATQIDRVIPSLIANLADPSKIVRFWCAYSLGVAGSLNKRLCRAALPALRELQSDDRHVLGFWKVADEARWSIAILEGDEEEANAIERRLYKDRRELR